MVIRWKVVDKKRRSYIISPLSKHSLEYIKGSIVEEKIKGLGIMCFETEEQAKEFGKNNSPGRRKILKVRVIGRGKKVEFVARLWKGSMLEKYLSSFNSNADHRLAPEGTICYKKVEVLT
jgi:hypothetical protein